jgi:hypothetical protein
MAAIRGYDDCEFMAVKVQREGMHGGLKSQEMCRRTSAKASPCVDTLSSPLLMTASRGV